MPSNIVQFERLSLASLVIGLISAVLQFQVLSYQSAPVGGSSFVIFVQGFTFALMVLLILLTSRGRKNWARWTMLILFFLGMPFFVFYFLDTFRANAIWGMLSALQVLLQSIALYLVFTGNAKEWFNPISPKKKQEAFPV